MSKTYVIQIWMDKEHDFEFEYSLNETKEALAVFKALKHISSKLKCILQLAIFEIDNPKDPYGPYRVFCHPKAPFDRHNINDLPQSIKDQIADLIELDNQIQNNQ